MGVSRDHGSLRPASAKFWVSFPACASSHLISKHANSTEQRQNLETFFRQMQLQNQRRHFLQGARAASCTPVSSSRLALICQKPRTILLSMQRHSETVGRGLHLFHKTQKSLAPNSMYFHPFFFSPAWA